MKILLATDHAGFAHKEVLRDFLLAKGYEVQDMSPEYIEGDDYPDQIAPAAQVVSDDPENTKAIIFGGSGQGEAMVANRYTNVRAMAFYGGRLPVSEIEEEGEKTEDQYDIVRLSRLHNNANVLSIGVRFVTVAEMKEVVTIWLETEFETGERHLRRINKF